jgi:hypothetical protein
MLGAVLELLDGNEKPGGLMDCLVNNSIGSKRKRHDDR